MQIESLDIAVIATYVIAIVGLGCWAGLRKRHRKEADEYFLAGKSLRWPVIGLALFATNISTIHLVSLAEEGYSNGLAYGNFEWMAPFTLIILALFFAPFYIRANVTTLPDFLERRYSRASRDWLALLSIVSAIFIHIGFSLYAGATVLEGLFGVPKMTSIVLIAAITGFYTIVGGLMAVVLTESVQTVILLIGAIILTAISFVKVGGWSGLTDQVDPVKLTVLRPASDPSGLPWYSVFLGYPIIGIWYWCTDQTIVQRVLGAKDENHARVGPLFAGFIKILPVFIFVLPGLLCLALIRKGAIPALPLDDQGQPDAALTYSHMITTLLPVGLRGLMAAALMAALMSTVSGCPEFGGDPVLLRSLQTLGPRDVRAQTRPDRSGRYVRGHGPGGPLVAAVRAFPHGVPGGQRGDQLSGPADHRCVPGRCVLEAGIIQGIICHVGLGFGDGVRRLPPGFLEATGGLQGGPSEFRFSELHGDQFHPRLPLRSDHDCLLTGTARAADAGEDGVGLEVSTRTVYARRAGPAWATTSSSVPCSP